MTIKSHSFNLPYYMFIGVLGETVPADLWTGAIVSTSSTKNFPSQVYH